MNLNEREIDLIHKFLLNEIPVWKEILEESIEDNNMKMGNESLEMIGAIKTLIETLPH